MKRFDEYMKAFILEMTIIVAALITMIPLFIKHYQEIPLGILLGGLIGGIPLLLFSLFQKNEENHKSLRLTIVILIIRIVLISGVLFLVGYLYYQRNIKLFNIFATAGGYLLSTICLSIVFIISKKGKMARV